LDEENGGRRRIRPAILPKRMGLMPIRPIIERSDRKA
jgi:hypothetical protein